ncbi:MAG: preprotein translocase subunit SecG [Campylobacteraceae bacterium]|jgi:preprotein translocase subunit SecG|nr:preprotein translocase subunit SecG [Campylobacteraceae bacterium]
MAEFLFVFQFILAVIITISVLLQKSSSIGLGAYSGSNESIFGAKGPGGFLAKFTFAVGIVFIINTLALLYLYNKQGSMSLIDSIPLAPVETPSAPIVPIVPADLNNTK